MIKTKIVGITKLYKACCDVARCTEVEKSAGALFIFKVNEGFGRRGKD